MLVTSVNTSTYDVTVTRGYGETSNTTVNGSSTIVPVVIIGQAFKSGSASTDLTNKATVQTDNYNYVQLFRVPIKVTKTAEATTMYGGKERVFQQKKKGITLLRDIEHAFLFGERYNDTTNGRRTTRGILTWISTNTTNVSGSLTFSALEAALRTVFRYGQDKKWVFTAPLVTSSLSIIAEGRGKVNIAPLANTYGVRISQWASPHGVINIVNDVNLTGATYGGYGIILELGELSYVFLQGRDVKLETSIQNPGDDFYLDSYLCEIGLEFHQEKKHSYLYGITGGSTS